MTWYHSKTNTNSCYQNALGTFTEDSFLKSYLMKCLLTYTISRSRTEGYPAINRRLVAGLKESLWTKLVGVLKESCVTLRVEYVYEDRHILWHCIACDHWNVIKTLSVRMNVGKPPLTGMTGLVYMTSVNMCLNLFQQLMCNIARFHSCWVPEVFNYNMNVHIRYTLYIYLSRIDRYLRYNMSLIYWKKIGPFPYFQSRGRQFCYE